MSGKNKLLILLLLLTFVAAGCGNPAGPTSQKVAPGPTERERAELLKKIDRRFIDPQAHYQLGRLYQADGLWDKAEDEYNLALSFDPVNWRAQAAIVKVLQQSGRTDKAETYADIRIKQVSGLAESSFLLGKAFQAEGLDRYALTCYEQALARAPESAAVNRQLGLYYLSLGDNLKAKGYLTRSFELDRYQPDVAGELGRLGIVVQTRQKTDQGSKALEKLASESEKPE